MKIKKSSILKNNDSGFSLTELMVVIILIGILAALAIPRFTSVTTKAKMTEAKMMLRQVYVLADAYHYEHDAYSDNLEAMGFEQQPLIKDGGSARYFIEIFEASDTSFLALATSVVDFDKDGIFNVWEVNQDGIIKQKTQD